LDALRAHESDDGIKDVLGQDFSPPCLNLKHAECYSFRAQFTPGEHTTTLNISRLAYDRGMIAHKLKRN